MTKLKKIFNLLILITISTIVILTYNLYLKDRDNFFLIKRSCYYLFNQYIAQKKYLIAKSIHGTQFKFYIKDAIGRSIYKKKNYEPDVTKFILQKIKIDEGDIILDVGANLGWYSINISNYNQDKNIQIFSFEPDDINFALLNDNIKLNNSTNIVTIKKAIAEKNTKKVLYKYSDKNLGRHSLFKNLKLNQEQVLVDSISLDEFVYTKHLNTNKIKLLKVDVEGYEYQVLLGCIKTLPNIKYIIHEFSPIIMKENNIHPENLLNLLLNNNFEAFLIVKEGKGISISPIHFKEMLTLPEATNLLWINKKKF